MASQNAPRCALRRHAALGTSGPTHKFGSRVNSAARPGRFSNIGVGALAAEQVPVGLAFSTLRSIRAARRFVECH